MSLGLQLTGPRLTLGSTTKPVAAPKIKQIRIKPIANGLTVKHVMANAKPKSFFFQNPALMSQHLKRIEKNEWLHPEQNPARRITSVLDLGEPA
jgi:hypothetical protein